MKGLPQEAELLEFKRDAVNRDWFNVRMAINGVLAVPFDVPVDTIYNLMDNEQKLGEYLGRQAVSMINEYGDARNVNPNAFSEFMEVA